MINTSKAKKALDHLLNQSKFDRKSPKLDVILKVFKEFSKIDIDCVNDDFLFQCGVFDFTGERLFYWDLVRQFVIHKKDLYSHMEQLHFEVLFEPNIELENFLIVEWSGEDRDEYFSKIGQLDGFRIPFERYVPVSISVFQERV